ncbi:MAG: tRNA lysidine(34) synthetase TilS, partial [Oscillospiraceae bacterium]|nr:tRNA lysidine(34) synthetase TilS [Oscillospiraceae bacterium]
MIPEGGTVLCAVSGGADSVCLLHWLAGLRALRPFTLVAAHYNHNLRGEESDRDEAFVRSFLRQCCPQVELIVGTGDVAGQARQGRQGIEETAREMRYAFLRQVAEQVGADVIATAHTADDNAETLLLNLTRGCGLRGLTGIPPCRDGLIRPLLTTHREQVEAYLRAFGLPHVEDSSNTDMHYTRNRMRHQVMPVLRDIQPRLLEHLSQTAHLLEQDE